MATVANVGGGAGVSVAVAGRVLSGSGYASEEARRAVLDAAREIGYVPTTAAGGRRPRRTLLAGLLIGDVETSFYSASAKNVESVAKDAGYHVVLCNSNDDAATEKEYLHLLEGMRVDGIIIPPTGRNQSSLRRLGEKGPTIVQIDRRVEGLKRDAILLDTAAGARLAVSHLIDAGHSRIGLLTGPPDLLTARDRQAGYEQSLSEHGILIAPELIRAGSFLHDHAIEAATALLRLNPPPTAIFAANNVLAEGCFMALSAAGMKVPKDMSVVAFDDVPWMNMVNPHLTAVRQPVADMARSAADVLLRRLREDGQRSPSTSVFQSELIVRGSVAPARNKASN